MGEKQTEKENKKREKSSKKKMRRSGSRVWGLGPSSRQKQKLMNIIPSTLTTDHGASTVGQARRAWRRIFENRLIEIDSGLPLVATMPL